MARMSWQGTRRAIETRCSIVNEREMVLIYRKIKTDIKNRQITVWKILITEELAVRTVLELPSILKLCWGFLNRALLFKYMREIIERRSVTSHVTMVAKFLDHNKKEIFATANNKKAIGLDRQMNNFVRESLLFCTSLGRCCTTATLTRPLYGAGQQTLEKTLLSFVRNIITIQRAVKFLKSWYVIYRKAHL